MNYLGASPRGIEKPTHKAKAEPTQGSGYLTKKRINVLVES